MPHLQDEIQSASLSSPSAFWLQQASHLHWHTPPTLAHTTTPTTLPSGTSHPTTTWFPDGQISTSYNCLDRHVLAGHGSAPALFWDSPVTGRKEKYTYAQLLEEVEVLAGVLREEGVRKGDVVLVYSNYAPPV